MWLVSRPRRAQREREEQLRSISDRLERLESTLREYVGPEGVKVAMAPTIGGMKGRADELADRIDKLESAAKVMTFDIDEAIQRTDRAERRIRSAVARARKELRKLGYEDPGLEAEDAELRLVNGKGSQGDRVPDLQPGMEESVDEASSIRGVSAEQLRRARGVS